jgi:dethiobiotin synthetase/adenosylmethionine--8-amino-7-oxononanoate aminotransferase
MVKGRWIVEPCNGTEEVVGKVDEFESLGEIFDLKLRRETNTAVIYREYITRTLQSLVQEEGMRFGALIMEPVILGAGGMILA